MKKGFTHRWQTSLIIGLWLVLFCSFSGFSPADEKPSPQTKYSSWLKTYLEGQSRQSSAKISAKLPTYSLAGIWIALPRQASLESGLEVRYEASDQLVDEKYRKRYINLLGKKSAYKFSEDDGWSGKKTETFTYTYPTGHPLYGYVDSAVADKNWFTELTFPQSGPNVKITISQKRDEIAKHQTKGSVLYEIHTSNTGSITLPREFTLGQSAAARFESDLNSNYYTFGLHEWLGWGVWVSGNANPNYYDLPEPKPNYQRAYTFVFNPVVAKDYKGVEKLFYIPTLTEGTTKEWDASDVQSFTYQSTFEHQASYDLKNYPPEFNASLTIPSPGSNFPHVFVQYSLGKISSMWKCTPLDLPNLSVSSDQAGEVSSLKNEHARLVDELKNILQKEPPAPKKGGSAEAQAEQLAEALKKFDEEIINKDQETRAVEKKYFAALSTCYGSASDANLANLRETLRAEAICLSQARTEALDEMREQTFRFTPNAAYFRYRRYYEAYLKDLKQILNIWNNFNRMELLRLDMLISELLKARAAHEPDYSDAVLRSLQTQLKNVYVDEAWIYAAREQCMAEDTLDSRDSYGAALVEARKQNLKQPWHNEFLKRQGQRAIYGTQYLMGTFGVMWTGMLDSLTRMLNAPVSLFDTALFTDLHASTNKSIKEVRAKIADRLSVIEALYPLGPEECKWVGAYARGDGALPDGINAKVAKEMENDRTYHEASGGGLMRLAACYETENAPRLEWEYRIELKHGKLCWADMRKTLYLREGRKETGEDPILRRMIDPLGIVKTSAAHYIGKQYDGAEDYLSERNGQLMEMEGLLPLFKKINFDLDIGITKYPTINQTLAALCQNNPDYMKFMQSYRMLWSREREIELSAVMSTAETKSEREACQFKLEMLKDISQRDAIPDFIRILKQQLSDKIAASDFEGALGVARQIEDLEPVGAKGLVSWLSQDFAWEQAKEVGINTAVSIGNQGLYAAFFARYLSPAAVRNQPVSFSNINKVFSTWKGFGGMLEFTWGQVNPFAGLMKTMTPKEMTTALGKTAITGMEQIAQERIKQNILIGYFGLDEKYADFLANVVINFEQMQREDPTSLTNVTARNLLRQIDAYTPDVVNLPGWQKVMDARIKMREYWLAMDALAKLETLKQEMQDARQAKKSDLPKFANLGKQIGKIMLKIRLSISPLNAETIRLVMQDYGQNLAAAKTPIERVSAYSELFRTLPFAALVHAKKTGNLPKDLEAKIDLARRETLSTIQTEFLKAYPGMAPYIDRYIYTGSGARETWSEYKKIGSDLDFTIILKSGVDIKIANNIKTAFDAFFEKTAKFPPEELDVHAFVDERPNLPSRGETAEQLIVLVKDSTQAARLSAESQKNIETLLANLGDAERYLSTGAVRFLNYLNKLGGRVKKPAGAKLDNDEAYQAELYKNVKFEPWMGLEIVLDNLKLIRAHTPKDRLDYGAMISKYALRILLARIIQSDKGLEQINKLDIAEIERNLETTGGIHGEFVRIAASLGGKFTESQRLLFRELNLKKQGKSWGEVLADRNGGKVMNNDDPSLNAAIEKHITETEKFMQESIRETAVTHTTEMKKLSDAYYGATEPAAKDALLQKYREILYSTATVWDALPEAMRKNVLATSPGMDEVYRALEDVRGFSEQKKMDLIRSYNPFQKSGEVPKSDQPEKK